MEDLKAELLDDIDDLEEAQVQLNERILTLQQQVFTENPQNIQVLSDGLASICLEPEKHFGKFNLVGTDVQELTTEAGQEFLDFCDQKFVEIAESREDLNHDEKEKLVQEVKDRYSKLRDLYRVADVLFSILGKMGRITDDDLTKLETAAELFGDLWSDIYAGDYDSFPPLLHQAVEHALDQGRWVRAFGSVNESEGEHKHALENALTRQVAANSSFDYEWSERRKDGIRELKDATTPKELMAELLGLTARGPKQKNAAERAHIQHVKQERRNDTLKVGTEKRARTETELKK
jgi:hypothetical protein